MSIEELIQQLESNLKEVGFNPLSSAYLIEININGLNYKKTGGNNSLLKEYTSLSTPSINFIAFIESECKIAAIRESTRKLHENTAQVLKLYNPKLLLSQIDHQELVKIHSFMKEKPLAANTIARHMKVIKRYVNLARQKDFLSSDPFFGFRIRSEETFKESLTEQEIAKIEHYRLHQTNRNEILDAFLFSCYTGLRYSDIRLIGKHNLQKINNKNWLILRMQKTSVEVRIPISSIFNGKAMEILQNYRSRRFRYFSLLPNNQKINRELLRLSKTLKINRHLTFHCARHTCATLLLQRGVRITTIQKILGHKNIVTTQIYSAITDLTIEKDILLSNKQKKK